MIKCKCGGNTGVVDTRERQRTRKCKRCSVLFTTYEVRKEDLHSFTTEELDKLKTVVREDLDQFVKDLEKTVSNSFDYLKARTRT